MNRYTRVIAIDPGPEKSGVVIWDIAERKVMFSTEIGNDALLTCLSVGWPSWHPDCICIEMIACYGMAVGKETFETCVEIGRMMEAARGKLPVFRVFRKDIKLHLCGSARAKDANIRQALIDKHGQCGTKKHPGPLRGISGHLWAALAVADYFATGDHKLEDQPND